MVSKTLSAVTIEAPAPSRIEELRAEAAINAYLVEFAMECGFALDVEEEQDDDGLTFFYLTPSEEDCILAARQQITVAAVLADLCKHLGIKPPSVVADALNAGVLVQ